MGRLLCLLFTLFSAETVCLTGTSHKDEQIYQHERRQLLSQTLGALEGVVGVNNTFNYVVIGAGTAVSVTRLFSRKNRLIEGIGPSYSQSPVTEWSISSCYY